MTGVRRGRGAIGPALVALLVGLALAGPAQADASGVATVAAARARPCAAKGSTTVARSVQARVYAQTQSESDDHTLVGCLLGSGHRIVLDMWFDCGCSRGDEIAPQAWLRGRVVAFNRYGCPPDPFGPCSGSARSVDLRTGRTLRTMSTGGSVAELVIAGRGAFAFVGGGAVRKVDADGEGTLDPGPGVEDASLALAGSLLYWTRDGAPRSARLHP